MSDKFLNVGRVEIEEMPQGCYLSQQYENTENVVLIWSKEDALAVIASLQKMIEIQYFEH